MARFAVFAFALCALLGTTTAALAQSRAAAAIPDGAELVRLLGARAIPTFESPKSPGIGALVRLPRGVQAGPLGLREVAPGIARLWETPSGLVSFAQAHPELPIEVAPPVHLLLDAATSLVRVPSSATLAREIASGGTTSSAPPDGTGTVVGIADTGIDLTHPDFLDTKGQTRVAWLLDLSAPPRGKWPALEQAYGVTDPTSGALVAGAVWSADDINQALSSGQTASLPQDSIGHGTFVSSCAAGNGAGGKSVYRGVAPGATIVLARIFDSSDNVLGNDAILRAVQFLYDQADALHLPVVVNLSVGSDFGPHDGTTAWEQVLASHVGPGAPGHVLVVAAGNSGSIAPVDSPIHENVFVSQGAMTRVPIVTSGAQNGSVNVWVAMHPGSVLRVGLDSPSGTWIAPVAPADSAGAMTGDYQAGVVNGSEPAGSPVPAQSHGAVVIWSGKWPTGTYFITLSGSGSADLYLQGDGDAAIPGGNPFGFAHGVRQGTITLPATEPNIISVGCTISKLGWRSINKSPFGIGVPLLDAVGGMPDPLERDRDPIEGEPCWFSSAGPTLTGVQKPEVAAPGAVIVGALSSQAIPPVSTSIFTTACPDGPHDQTCQEVDPLHAASAGTSFSAPLVAGAVAVFLQHDNSLTEADALNLLQGGAHRLRGPAQFDDQSGVGELDVLGGLALLPAVALESSALPNRMYSWLTLGAEFCLADGSTPLEVVFDLRGSPVGSSPPPVADGFEESRLSVYARITGAEAPLAVVVSRKSPGIRVATIRVPPGLGGSKLTVGALFDGVDVVQPKTLPIATDIWSADYVPAVAGGCSLAATAPRGPGSLIWLAAGTVTVFLGAFRFFARWRGASRRPTRPPRRSDDTAHA